MLVALLVAALVPPVVSANVTPLASLVMVEELLYGDAQAGALLERIEKVELDIYGAVQEGAVLTRIDRVLSFLQSSDGGSGLQLQLNLAEWGLLCHSQRRTGHVCAPRGAGIRFIWRYSNR